MALLALCAALARCGAARVPPIGDGPFALQGDEERLWTAATREAEAISRAGALHEDPALDAYLSGLAAGLMAEPARAAGAPAPTVSVLLDPALNAFALPNGRIFLHSGLLARTDNESQLAAILAREVAHVRFRHALSVARGGRESALTAGLASAPTGLPRAAWPIGTWPLARLAAVEGFGARREREADAEGLASMARAGHDPREALRIFSALAADHGDSRDLERYVLGDRAWLAARVRSARVFLRDHASGSPRPAGGDELARWTLSLVRDNARLEIQAGRFHLARAQLDRVLAAAPGDAVAQRYDGDLHRIRAQRAPRPEDARVWLDRARRAYERAGALDPASPEPHRALALLHYQEGDAAAARASFERYLELRPDAPDAPRIREYLRALAPR